MGSGLPSGRATAKTSPWEDGCPHRNPIPQRGSSDGSWPVNVLEFTLVVWLVALAAGFLGALTGLGGGVVIVPVLVLLFHVDLRYAIGASLVSVIATSSGAAVGLRPRRVFEHPDRHVAGNRHHLRCPGGGLPDDHCSGGSDRGRFRRGPAAVGLPVEPSALRKVQRRPTRSAGRPSAPGCHLSNAGGAPRLPGPSRTPGFRPDVHCGRSCRACWASAPARSRCWPWIRPCASPSRCPPPPATS